MVDPSPDFIRVKQVDEKFYVPLDESVDVSWRFAFESVGRKRLGESRERLIRHKRQRPALVPPMLEGFISFELAGIPFGEAQRRLWELVTAGDRGTRATLVLTRGSGRDRNCHARAPAHCSAVAQSSRPGCRYARYAAAGRVSIRAVGAC
jgi:hypothetical protein